MTDQWPTVIVKTDVVQTAQVSRSDRGNQLRTIVSRMIAGPVS